MPSPPETTLTFYEDFYRTELEVWVDALTLSERFGPCLVLSETLCHPHGGGQKGDRAVLALDGEVGKRLGLEKMDIVDTRREGERIVHVLDGAADTAALEEALVGTRPFLLRLDWKFRHHQMRLHSAAHLLHCFVEKIVGEGAGGEGAVGESAGGPPLEFPETSDLQPEFGLNRYARKELLDAARMERVVAELNAFSAEGHAIATRPDPETEGFRYWECAEWIIPCGGTHPRNTAEIGPVEATLSLKRGKTGMTFRVPAG